MSFTNPLLKDLQERGLVFQCTHQELDELLNESLTLYCGFDPSADSLHVGNLLMICGLARFRRAGHRPLALVGGATGLIGDPSGKTEERNLLDDETISKNIEGIGLQLRRILDRSLTLHADDIIASSAEIPLVNNADWMRPWSYIDFLRDVGKNFRVNQMLGKDSVRSRLEEREQGLSYTEFSYMLIQAYDFLHLHREYGCMLQIGGSDQWGNITAGTDLIRRVEKTRACGLTFPLITSASGQKFGKTEAGAVWLDPARTTPYEFYQYWVRREDAEVIDLLKKFTFLPTSEIESLEAVLQQGDNRGELQVRLAQEVTDLVHGPEETRRAQSASRMLFGEEITGLSDRELASVFAEVPSSSVPRSQLQDGISILDLFASTKLATSKSEGRRLIAQGGGYVNNRRVDVDTVVNVDFLASESMLVLRAGKKRYHLVRVEE